MITADGIIKQDCVTNKFGFDIHGQTFDVDEKGLTMHEETNDSDTDNYHNSNNNLFCCNDIEIVSDEYLISEQKIIRKDKKSFLTTCVAIKLKSNYLCEIAQMIKDNTEIQIMKSKRVRITSSTEQFIKGMAKKIFNVFEV